MSIDDSGRDHIAEDERFQWSSVRDSGPTKVDREDGR